MACLLVCLTFYNSLMLCSFFFFSVFIPNPLVVQWSAVVASALMSLSASSNIQVCSGSVLIIWFLSSFWSYFPVSLHASLLLIGNETLWILPCWLLHIFVLEIFVNFVLGHSYEMVWSFWVLLIKFVKWQWNSAQCGANYFLVLKQEP